MEGMRDTLMCPIHLDLLENAKTLPCQHVVCEECIGLWVAKKGELVCPTCKKRQNLPVGGVSNLPTNFMVNGLVEELKKVGEIKGDLEGAHGRRKSIPDKKKGKNKGSPITKPQADPRTSFIEKKSKIYEDICSSLITLHVQLCDSAGKDISKSESDRILVSVITPNGKRDGASVTYQNKEGVFLVSFVPKLCGVHRIEATIGKQHIKDSPMTVVVHPEGKFLTRIRSQLKSPKDVFCEGYSLHITDSRSGPFLCVDWLGRPKIEVGTPQGADTKDISPFGIVQANDKVFVTDSVNNCVYIYNKNGSYISSFGKGHLKQPMGIAVSRNQVFFVANNFGNEISVFSPKFAFLRSILVEGGKKPSSKPSLACLAMNQEEDKFIVADQGNCYLKIIDINKAKVVNTITTRVGMALARPFGVAVDKDDNIYVTVSYNPADRRRTGPKDHALLMEVLIDGSKGAVLMYNSKGYFLGRFGDNELTSPGGIQIVEKPSMSAIVVDMEGDGYGSKGPGIKVFSI